ncbi:S-adenosylmethionine-dependent methyltransferase [Polymorphobacter arshaanensis]|uniref:S-adenosylmethionine-dependent methyltransferase n=1 Tax=Glacieibacterium arshaanense TaxID=2511025 RepID=A0A4Y9EKQ1_9SPHN|nr:SAM-dependent methyltransferase [Polymorphobacter arshaanensis]TFU00394.1 S-adenosylmethionine-dependent methyltransferase [Polymorphobacter arshaanensis]
MSFTILPVGQVVGGRIPADDDDWDGVTARIELDTTRFGPEALQGLDAFSHAEIVYLFDKLPESQVSFGARRPRGNPDWPLVGIFAQRGRNRPNRLAVSVCRIEKVEGTTLHVRGLDAIDGTPVIDIKPVMQGFAPRGELREPDWAREIMSGYW